MRVFGGLRGSRADVERHGRRPPAGQPLDLRTAPVRAIRGGPPAPGGRAPRRNLRLSPARSPPATPPASLHLEAEPLRAQDARRQPRRAR
ncbi:hypothetical protein QJS66_03390 [Kocuria rhizophila]|nr:hypothetical protein QJS66_03390 [Kocuria rhizophila]